MILRITRNWPKSGYTIGRLYVNGVLFCNTLEDEDRKLTSSMPLGEIMAKKIYGQTAIPKGTYRLEMDYSPKFSTRIWGMKYKGIVPHIDGVPGFSGIRIHPGTTAKDVEGCVLVGKNTVKGALTSSQATYCELMDRHLIPAMKRREQITIEIV